MGFRIRQYKRHSTNYIVSFITLDAGKPVAMGPVSGRPGRKPAGGARIGPVVIAVTEVDGAEVAELDIDDAVDADAGGSDAATVGEGRLRKQGINRVV